MATIQRIGPASAFKVGFVVYACLGFLAGILCSAIAFAGVPFAPHEHLPRVVTLFAVVLCPIVYGLIGCAPQKPLEIPMCIRRGAISRTFFLPRKNHPLFSRSALCEAELHAAASNLAT